MNKEKYAEFTAGPNDDGKRIDRIIRQFIRRQSLSGIYKAFRKGLIRVNEKKASPESKISSGDSIFIYKSLISFTETPDAPPKTGQDSNAIKQMIVYEDENLLALNKKRGELVHGEKGSLEEKVREYLIDKISPSLSFRPGPLHRLDRNTSGLIFFSKSIIGARSFSQELQNNNFEKFYIALLDGEINKKELWKDNLFRDTEKKTTSVSLNGGKNAITHIAPLFVSHGHTLALIKIETGRTHQIRSQASFHKHPLTGDKKYGGNPLKNGYFLHSFTIKIKNGKSELIKENIIASPYKESINRLNRVLSNCRIDQLEKRIFTVMGEL